MGKRCLKPKGKVTIKWSPNFAYGVGLIVTDGNVRSAGGHVSFVSKDREQVDNFLSVFRVKARVGKTFSGYKNTWAYRVQIGDVLFCKFLKSIGILPTKSLTIGKLAVPEKYFFDFLRGCFDGDGCSYSYWDPRWKSSFMFYIGFASGSLKFAEWLQSMTVMLSSLKGHLSVHQKKGAKNCYYQLRYSKYEAIKLAKLMYGNPAGLRLERKYLKIARSLDIVRKHKDGIFQLD